MTTEKLVNVDCIKGTQNSPILSILICSLKERKDYFLSRLLNILEPQIAGKDVEILIFTDHGEMPIGSKRNFAMDSCSGTYFCFIDDDDLVTDDYVDLILEKTKENPDVISICGFVTTNGKDKKSAQQSVEFKHSEVNGVYYRLPNHLSIHRKENCYQRFLDVRTGEDDEWAARRITEIKTESRILKEIYHYDFRTDIPKYFNEKPMDKEILDSLFQITINKPMQMDEGTIKLDIPYFSEIEKILKNTPLFFTLYDRFERVVWETEMHSGYFSYWPGVTWTRAELVDSAGNLIWEWRWDPVKDGCICHQIFHLWSLQNRGSFGIAIGTHDGCTGEWVGAVESGRLKALLIEASSPQFEKLEERYGRKNWVKVEKNLITVDGGKIKFFEGGKGYTNSISLEFIKSTGVDEVKEIEKDSESFISLLERNPGCRWIHLDVEGIDDLLILSLESRPDLLPDVFIYEHENLTFEREAALLRFLENHGYSIYKGKARNSIALK